VDEMALARNSGGDPEAESSAKGQARRERLVVTVPGVALLGISRALAYNLAAQGELPVIRLGHRLRVPRRALLDLVGGEVPLLFLGLALRV
jgi:excisionase family DNA binding protein